MSSTAHSPTVPAAKSPKKGLSSAAGEDPGGHSFSGRWQVSLQLSLLMGKDSQFHFQKFINVFQWIA